MANTIRIKRSASTNTPGSLSQGELANSESGSPNGINELFVGTTGPTVTKIVRNLNGAPAEPTAGLADAVIASGDYLIFEDITDSQGKRELISDVPVSYFNNDAFVESVTATASAGITVAGTATDPTVGIDYLGTDNFIDVATNLEGTPIASGDTIVYHDATDNNVKKGFISDLPISGGDANLADDEIVTGTWTLDGPVTGSDFGTGGKVKDGTDTARPIGFNVLPVYEIDANDTFDLAHNGFLWHKDAGVAVTYTCANDATIPQGATYVVHNDDTETLTIAQGTGVTIYWLEAGTAPAAGNVTVSQGGIVTVYKYSDTEFWVWGAKQQLTYVEDITANVGIVNTGTAKNPALELDFSELADLAGGSLVGTDELIVQDGGTTESRVAINEIDVGLFDNATTEYVSENDSIVVVDWNWVLDEDLMTSDSATHVPTQQSVKAYVDTAVTSGMTYKGGYNAATNTPALDTGSPTLEVGDTYTVTAAGNFFTEAVEVGDVLIAEVDSTDAANINDWTILQNNIGAASETAAGYAELATQAETDGASDDARIVTPLKLHATTFDGGTF